MSGSLLHLAERIKELGGRHAEGEAGPVSVREDRDGIALTVHVPRASFESEGLGGVAAAMAALLRTRAVALLDPWAMPVGSLRILVDRLCRLEGWSVMERGRGSSSLLLIAARHEAREVYFLAPAGAVVFDPTHALREALSPAALANVVPRPEEANFRVIASGSLEGVAEPVTAGDFRAALLAAGVQVDDLLDPWLAELRVHEERSRALAEDLAGRELALKRVERELFEARASIQRDERSLVASRFAGFFRHKIKNPLASLMADTETITGRSAEEWDDEFTAKVKRTAGRIGSAARRITAIIDGLDRTGGALVPDRQPATGSEVLSLVREAARIVPAWVPVEIAEPNQAAAAAVLEINPAALADVFEEIFVNAAHHPARERPLKVSVGFALEGDPARWSCRIQDTGTGVPTEARPRIFDYGFTRRSDGTGKGLALCRQYVEELGGRITEEGSEGGAVFVIRLPVADGEGGGS